MAKDKQQNNKSTSDPSQNIKVFVRMRPLNKEKEKRSNIEVFSDRNEVRLAERNNVQAKQCLFDGAFDEKSCQIEVYKRVVSPLIQQVLDGYNCTVFAYGQTGTGKTFTMEGERSNLECSWQEDPLSGIIPRALNHLFENISSNDVVRVSFLELYNEELYDLLGPCEDTNRLRIFEDASRKGSVIVSGLEEVAVRSRDEIYEILKRGTSKRQTAATLMNARSSRSHTIFSVTVHIKDNEIDGEDLVKIGKLNLVDLAGSENIGRSGAIDKRAREAGNINQSLLTLGRVITSLVEKAPHVPFRESKLTRLLQDSLGGRTLTSIIATISPSQADFEDTVSTLEYAQRAKKITNKPEVNQKVTLKAVLRDYQDEIEKLRRDLLACREKNGFMVDEKNYKEMCKKIDEMEANIKALEEEKEKVLEVFSVTKESLQEKEQLLTKTSEDLKTKEKLLHETKIDLNAHIKVINHQEEANLKLADQAKALLNVADKSTLENKKLFEKIERQKFAEITNRAKLESFQTNFQKELKNLENRIDFGSQSNQELLKQIQTTTKNNLESANEQQNLIKERLDQYKILNETQDKSTNKIIETFTNFESLKKMKENLNTRIQDVLKETHSSLCDEIDRFNDEFDENVKLFTDAVLERLKFTQEILDKQKESYNHSIRTRDRLVMETRERFSHIIDYQKNEIKKRIDENNELKKTLGRNSNANIEKVNEMIKSLEALKQQQTETRIKVECTINNKIRNIDDNLINLETTQKDLVCYFDTASSNMIKEDEENLNNYDLLNAMVSSTLPMEVCDFQESIRSIREKSDERIKELDTVHQMNCEQLDNMAIEEINLLQVTSEVCVENGESVKETIKQKDDQFVQIFDGWSTYAEQIKKMESDFDQELDNAVKFNSELQDTYKSELTLKENHLAGLKRDLVKCDPTGNTPQKSAFDFPKEIKPVTPYQKILSRFMTKNEVDLEDLENIKPFES